MCWMCDEETRQIEERFQDEEKQEQEKKVITVKDILSSSDIVWPKYGTDNTDSLARRILEAVNE